jgi:hypothetical protein
MMNGPNEPDRPKTYQGSPGMWCKTSTGPVTLKKSRVIKWRRLTSTR